jgi:hypothetical protein
MNIKTVILAAFLALCAGSILLLIDKEYIIIRTPSFVSQPSADSTGMRSEKKEISFYVWHNTTWLIEKKQCIWLAGSTQESLEQNKIKQANLKHLVVTWLATLQAELGLPTADIAVQAATLNPSGYVAYISFGSYPLPENSSIHAKLMWIEGLLKTIRSSWLALQSVHFLHNHQPLLDPHLDFTNPWPVHGFVNK